MDISEIDSHTLIGNTMVAYGLMIEIVVYAIDRPDLSKDAVIERAANVVDGRSPIPAAVSSDDART